MMSVPATEPTPHCYDWWMITFKEAHPEIQQLALEHDTIRRNNQAFEARSGTEGVHLMFAEGALVCLILERFVRAVLGYRAEEMTLRPMLEQSVARGLLRVPWDDQQDGIGKIMSIRNRLLHGDFEAAAVEAKCKDVADYFATQYTSEVERMNKIADFIVPRGSPKTGQA